MLCSDIRNPFRKWLTASVEPRPGNNGFRVILQLKRSSIVEPSSGSIVLLMESGDGIQEQVKVPVLLRSLNIAAEVSR